MVLRITIWESDINDGTVNAKLLSTALLRGWFIIVQKARHFFVIEPIDSEFAWLLGSYGIYS